MQIDDTRVQLFTTLSALSTNQIIDYLEDLGLECKEEFDPIPVGLYRREKGHDLAYYNARGDWRSVTCNGATNNTFITWVCLGKQDWWIQVLDANKYPVVDAFRFLMDRNGNRVG